MNPSALPPPPSPITSSPGLTQSTSNSGSNSSSSPPQPETPLKQPRPRYPDIGRVPLHRRGTSQTYERLEDLLREAGYKETRIFTPESDRLESHRHDNIDSQPSKQQGQGVGAAVVGFLTGLVTGTISQPLKPPRQTEDLDDNNNHPDLPSRLSRAHSPLSPLASRPPLGREDSSRSAESSEPQTPFMTSSIESLGDPTPRAQRPPRSTTPNLQVHHYHHHQHYPAQLPQHRQRVSAAQRHLQKQASKSSFHTHSSIDLSPDPHPSRAGAYLRHMVSSSSIPQRPKSTPAAPPQIHIQHDSDHADNGDAAIQPSPPLPRKWLDTVARAVLFGGAGAYPGGPSNSLHHHHPVEHDQDIRTLRPTRSSLSQTTIVQRSKSSRRFGLSDRTNRGAHHHQQQSNASLAPPVLFTRIERGRARCSESQVIKTQVVCRSAPGSRASSVVRTDNNRTKDSSRKQKHRSQRGEGSNSHRRTTEDNDLVPCLARTRAEGDGWHGSSALPPRSRRRGDKLGGVGGDFGDVNNSAASDNEFRHGGSEHDDNDDDEEDEEDDGELDLARMLVPPKRQRSIKSLRKHLIVDGSAANTGGLKLRVSNPTFGQGGKSIRRSTARGREWNEGEGVGWEHYHYWRRGDPVRSTSGDGEEEIVGFDRPHDAKGRTRSTTHSRLGLPGPQNTRGI